VVVVFRPESVILVPIVSSGVALFEGIEGGKERRKKGRGKTFECQWTIGVSIVNSAAVIENVAYPFTFTFSFLSFLSLSFSYLNTLTY
jgi:hypothetical protein